MSIITSLLGFLTGGVLDRVLDTVDKKIANENDRDRIKADIVQSAMSAKASIITARTWWFQLFFVIPLGVWWTAVIVDSIFQFKSWDVAALPPPLNDWATVMVTSLFLTDGVKVIRSVWRK